MSQPPVALTIAGSDSGGGAGIQADLKTFAALGVYGTSVLTALTAQNTVGVQAIHAVPPSFVERQLDSVLTDLPPMAVKTGMLANAAILATVSRRELPQLVVDPVLVASSGDGLFDASAEAYLETIVPHATVLTPNKQEARALTGKADMAEAAAELGAAGARWVVVKGSEQGTDLVWHAGHSWLLEGPAIDTRNTHGSGCTFAAAITAYLARGMDPEAAIGAAKRYVSKAIAAAASWRLGAGHGPLSWEVPA